MSEINDYLERLGSQYPDDTEEELMARAQEGMDKAEALADLEQDEL